MQEGFRRIQGRVPFAIKELHPDNGPEFFNDHMVRFWGEEITGLRLSRSRPYYKNDNRWVEQKNDTLVRAYLGNGRLDTAQQVAALNELYDLMWVLGLLQPVPAGAAPHREAVPGHPTSVEQKTTVRNYAV